MGSAHILHLTEDPMSLFDLDDYGVYRVKPQAAPFAEALKRVETMLSDDEVARDVVATARGVELRANVPAGNSAVIDAGWDLFGSRPYKIWKGEKQAGFMHAPTEKEKRLLRARRIKMYEETEKVIGIHESTQQLVSTKLEEIAYKINSHQIKTGHAFDNTQMGDVTRAAMSTIIESLKATSEFPVDGERYIIMACDALYHSLVRQGMRPGSLRVSDAMLVRCVSNKDGLIPVWAHEHGLSPYDKEDERRILRRSGGRFSAKSKIGTQIMYQYTHRGEQHTWQGDYPYIKALEDFITSYPFRNADLIPVITSLERVQKSGVKDGQGPEEYLKRFPFHQGDGKARSVSPLEDVPGLIEAMTVHAFNEECKRLKISFFPSIQTPGDREQMMADFGSWLSENPDLKAIDLDLSKYDKRIFMDYVVTIFQRVIKPFYHTDDWKWIDATCVIITYKLMMLHTPYLKMVPELVQEAGELGSVGTQIGDMTFFPLWQALMSGLRGTHIAIGSCYNIVAVQWAPLLKLADTEGILETFGKRELEGKAAGDDVLAVVPARFVQPGDPAEICSDLFSAIKSVCGQEINPKKLIWEFVDDESGSPVKIVTYLQESHVFELGVYSLTSEARAAAGYWISEDQDYRRNPFLEAIGVLSKAQNGRNDPLRRPYLEYMLRRSDVLWYAFSEYGSEAWNFLVKASSLTMEEIMQRLGIGDFYWGASRDDFAQGKLSILADVIDVCNSVKEAGDREPVSSKNLSMLLEQRQQSSTFEEDKHSRWDDDMSSYD